MRSYEIHGVGKARGSLRFYKVGRRLLNAGFAPGVRFKATCRQDRGLVELTICPDGDRVVSMKKGSSELVPVIDINANSVLGVFEGMDRVRVFVEDGCIKIMALATEERLQERMARLRRKLANGEPLSFGSVSHGAGILSSALHRGMEDEGLACRLSFANDIEDGYLAQSERHGEVIDGATMILAAPIQEVAFDESVMSKLPKVEVFEGGLPCVGASLSGLAKKHLAMPECDPNAGHLIVSFLTMIARVNPVIVILENVTQYRTSASYAIYQNQMRDFGYEVTEMVLSGNDFGSLEDRNRMCSVSVSRGMQFSFDMVTKSPLNGQTLGQLLDPIAADDPVWSAMPYLKEKAVRDKACGKGFKRQEIQADSQSIPVITRGYNKRRSTDPMLVNPTNPDLLRLLTVREHARVKGVPEHFVEGLCPTTGHQVLGQGVCFNPFRAVGAALAKGLKRLDERAHHSMDTRPQLDLGVLGGDVVPNQLNFCFEGAI